jgi:sialic acid synthase SpsE
VVADVKAGDPVTEENVRSIRPTGGLEPDMIGTVLGRTFTADAAKGTPLTWDLI